VLAVVGVGFDRPEEGGNMASYAEVQEYVQQRHGFVPKTCWIAHVKELNGLPVQRAWNRAGRGRVVPCPPEKRRPIEDAFRHFRMMPG
jgi:hypothetical protein